MSSNPAITAFVTAAMRAAAIGQWREAAAMAENYARGLPAFGPMTAKEAVLTLATLYRNFADHLGTTARGQTSVAESAADG